MKGGVRHATCVATNKAVKSEIEAAVKRVPANLERRPILPWIGEGYGWRRTFGAKRVLVLGHSNYERCRLCHRRGRSTKSLAGLTCYSVAARMLGDEAAYNRHWPSSIAANPCPLTNVHRLWKRDVRRVVALGFRSPRSVMT